MSGIRRPMRSRSSSKLRDEGKITAEEYEDMKKRAMMQV